MRTALAALALLAAPAKASEINPSCFNGIGYFDESLCEDDNGFDWTSLAAVAGILAVVWIARDATDPTTDLMPLVSNTHTGWAYRARFGNKQRHALSLRYEWPLHDRRTEAVAAVRYSIGF